MKLYLLTQNENNGYDTYDSMVIAAENKTDAKFLSYLQAYMLEEDVFRDSCWGGGNTPVWRNYYYRKFNSSSWSKEPSITKIANKTTHEEGVVCASFNAG